MIKYSKIKLFESISRIQELSGQLLNNKELNEIDWEGDFSDVKTKCLVPQDLKEYLNYLLENKKKPYKNREKLALDKPYIHSKAIPVKSSGDIDIDAFIKDITTIPKNILSENTKIEKSSTEEGFTVNIGIPALRGLVYDVENNMFHLTNTCPGAGSCAVVCYARQGSYIMFANVFRKQTRILNLLMNNPGLFERLLKNELEKALISADGKYVAMRWNDAGDFFSKKYLEIALNITKDLKSKGYDIKSYAYTKIGDLANLEDPDITVSFSNDANKRETSKVKDIENRKTSVIVKKEYFQDLFVKDPKNPRNFLEGPDGKLQFKNKQMVNVLKFRLATAFGSTPDRILTYEELLSTPEGKKLQYDVIITPKDGDIAAQREDVRVSFLLIH
jgi:hypothetical protein